MKTILFITRRLISMFATKESMGKQILGTSCPAQLQSVGSVLLFEKQSKEAIPVTGRGNV
jgi:hypothetical protein